MSAHHKGTRIAHLNVYHLFNKLSDVCLLLNNQQIHILGLSETRLESRHTDEMLQIPNYSILRRDATKEGETGLAVYIHNSLSRFVVRRSDLESQLVECIWLELKYSQGPPLLIGYVYRNPKANDDWFNNYVEMMDKVKVNRVNISLLGDHNFDLLKPQVSWHTTYSLFGLHQLITTPTRGASATLLDHIYTNNKKLTTDIDVIDRSISDHACIACTWLYKPPKQKQKGHTIFHYRSFKKL